MRELLQYALFLLVPFAVQLVILLATESRFQPLRLAVPVLVGAAVVLVPLLCCLSAPKGLGILVLPLVIVICLALAGLALVGCGASWLVYYLIKRKAENTENLSVQLEVPFLNPAHPAEPEPKRPAQHSREHK